MVETDVQEHSNLIYNIIRQTRTGGRKHPEGEYFGEEPCGKTTLLLKEMAERSRLSYPRSHTRWRCLFPQGHRPLVRWMLPV